ncbi:hepatic lectin-like [Scyliorhinus torazame]|uniref:hepatic lectin-like n=1 Tax=Scyliorhinus torazame TaxID=75743 RepID=UPI003B59038E
MAGELAYGDFDNFSLENGSKQKWEKQIPGSRFKSIFSAKVLMVLICILLGVFLILLVTGVIKCSETNETVEEFQSQSQVQVSHALNNVSQKADLEDFAQLIQVKVTEMGATVMAELSKKITSLQNIISQKLETFQRPECQNLQCRLKWISFNGSCYFFSTNKGSWSSSKTYCSILKSNLLVINTIEEQHFVAMESNTNEFWIGLSDHEHENKWKWVDGTDYEATPKFWSVGEPNNANSGEDCAQISSGGRWNDNNCSGKRLYICEQEGKSD